MVKSSFYEDLVVPGRSHLTRCNTHSCFAIIDKRIPIFTEFCYFLYDANEFARKLIMEIQKKLFEEIKLKLEPNLRLADVISDLLNIGSDSTYRRIRGEKELSMSELAILSSRFKISIDALFNNQSDSISFKYTQLNMQSPNQYEDYITSLVSLYGSLAKNEDSEIKITAQDIPIFHFLPFTELTFFKLYSLFRSLNTETQTYEAFIKKLNKENLELNYKAIINSFLQIPSTEIWSNHTIEPILNLLTYYNDLNCFESKQTAPLLGKQLLDLIRNIEHQAQFGLKTYNRKQTSFKFYLSPVDMQNDFILTKGSEYSTTSIKLFTINGIFSANQLFNQETEKWIDNIISKSLQLSENSERERFRFFQQQKAKINNWIKILEKQ